MSKVAVIGGGAAGMMAAIRAANNGHQVILLEKNEKLGKKIFITGKGRCNVTNASDMENLFANIVTNGKFMYSAFYTFTNQDMMDFLSENGCPVKVERGERVFPVSDHSSDVIRALEKSLKKLQVSVHLHTAVSSLIVEEGQVRGVRCKNGKSVMADAVIVATGGLSYSSTGSTGEGHKMAELAGHSMKECKPALVPLELKEPFCRDLMGLSLKNVSLKMTQGKKLLYEGFGEMLFTHFGISGPLVLSASSFYQKRKLAEEVQLSLDLKPALLVEQLDKRILRDFDENKQKQFKNAISGLFPAKLIPVMILYSGIDPEKKVSEITKEERKHFVDIIKHFPLHIIGTRPFEEAIITQGGISVKEINPSTMESKLVKNLYFAGEVLDVDALTGGYNLQIAWSTGYLAGESIV